MTLRGHAVPVIIAAVLRQAASSSAPAQLGELDGFSLLQAWTRPARDENATEVMVVNSTISNSSTDFASVYVGCFKVNHSLSDPDFKWKAGGHHYNAATCLSACVKKGHAFFALQHDGDCYCGKNTVNAEKLPAAPGKCGDVCAHDDLHWCGSAEKRAVYEVARISSSFAGCWRDDEKDRSFSIRKKGLDFNTASCKQACAGYSFMALQAAGKNCFCGNHFKKDKQRHAKVPDNKCAGACAGESGSRCGGRYVNAVYTLHSMQLTTDSDVHVNSVMPLQPNIINERVEAQPKAATKAEAQPEAAKKVEAKPQPANKVHAKPQPAKKVQAKPQPAKKVEAKPEAAKKVEAKPEVAQKAEAQPEAAEKVEAQPEAEAAEASEAAPAQAEDAQAAEAPEAAPAQAEDAQAAEAPEAAPAAEAPEAAPAQTEDAQAAEAPEAAPVQAEDAQAAEAPEAAPAQAEAGEAAEAAEAAPEQEAHEAGEAAPAEDAAGSSDKEWWADAIAKTEGAAPTEASQAPPAEEASETPQQDASNASSSNSSDKDYWKDAIAQVEAAKQSESAEEAPVGAASPPAAPAQSESSEEAPVKAEPAEEAPARAGSRAAHRKKSPSKAEDKEWWKDAAVEMVTAKVERMDANKDGLISKEELSATLMEVDAERWTEVTVQMLFWNLDANADDVLQPEEYTPWFRTAADLKDLQYDSSVQADSKDTTFARSDADVSVDADTDVAELVPVESIF